MLTSENYKIEMLPIESSRSKSDCARAVKSITQEKFRPPIVFWITSDCLGLNPISLPNLEFGFDYVVEHVLIMYVAV